jgi:hypothetical protein
MAVRKDNAPKSFREVPCVRCGNNFQSSGPNHKRCDPCKVEHKREYERTNKRHKKTRLAACSQCGEAFPPDVHAHRRKCTSCASKARAARNNASNLRRHYRLYPTDAGHRLHLSISVLVRRALGQDKAGRSWEALVGYSLADLRQHLERQFVKGMSWENYGSHWHVDHIVPRSLFSFDSAGHNTDFKACWSLSNLRPLWATENRKKNGKRLHLL